MPSIMERWRTFKRPAVVNITISGDASTQVLNYTAKQLYQTQDNLQAVINFLSNSIAQLPLKVYIRDGENERRRDRDSVAAELLWRPNADQTEFEFIRSLAIEYFVFGSVYVWLLLTSTARAAISSGAFRLNGSSVPSRNQRTVRTRSGSAARTAARLSTFQSRSSSSSKRIRQAIPADISHRSAL